MTGIRKRHTAQMKTKVAIEAIKGDKTGCAAEQVDISSG